MTLPNETSIGQTLSHLKRIAPQGFAMALHMRFTAPRLMFTAYSKEWVELYARQGFLLTDPTVRWCMTQLGVLRWERIEDDPDGVMSQAARYGLKHGFSYAMEDETRSMGGFARADRPFSEDEIETVRDHVHRLHALTRGIDDLPRETRLKLRSMSITVQEG